MLDALQYFQKGFIHFCDCMDFGKSFMDADAIKFMNESQIQASSAIKKAMGK